MEEQHFMKKYWKLSRWELGFGDSLEKSILAVIRITSDNFTRNQKITYSLLGEYSSWLNELKKNWNLNRWQSCMQNSTIFGKN